MQLGLGTLISKAGVIESPALVTNTKSLDFDGSDDYLQDTTNGMDNYAEGNPFSISAWIRPGDVSGAQTIACWGKSINSRWFGLVGDYPNVSCYEGGDFSTPIGRKGNNVSLSADTWYHLCVTYNGNGSDSDFKLYINGTEESSYDSFDNQSANMFNSAEIGRIGRTGGESDQKPFNGNIDEVAFWTSELSADEVQQIYDNGTGGTHLDLTVNSVKYTSSSNLNGWIRCGDVSGPYVIQNSAVTPESNLLPDNGVNATNWSEAQAHNGVAGSDLVISQVGSTLKLSQEGASAGFAYHNIITLDSSSTYIVTFNQSGGSVAQMNVRAYKNWPAITSMYVGGSVYFGPGLDEYNFEFVTGGSGTTLSLVFGNIGNGKSLILSEIKVQKVSRGPLFMGSMTATNIKSEVP
tara:strand:- start:223 stop:1443 length:1221 start_codon:yes stop_codon:yes gene_type:complete